MKFLLISLSLLIFNAWPSETSISVIGACDEEFLISNSYNNIPNNWSVGDLTINFLNESNIPYQGTRESIGQMLEIPSDSSELIVISDTEMLAYGWCYKINGVAPESYPHQVEVLPGDTVLWYFAYSRYLNGKWVSQCVPSYQKPRQEFCDI